MGFDNECILNIQSLPGEYFCPVCRTLIYPNEALQSQCTHLYCKPCLAYVVATTRACPYDGYLVTETDSKPLVESNKSLAETIGKVAVRCLYYRSGCQWQGGLSECVNHCAECTFGNSAVICNRCGTQILHRQVQEHGQTCPGMQPQGQQVESQAQDSKAQVQAVVPDQSSAAPAASAPAAPTAASAAAPTAVTAAPAAPSVTAPGGQGQIQSNAVAYQQAAVQAQTPDQWYQQQQQLQYQQYYQQYPGYDPYQQQYQQYAQYQQQAHPQYAQQQMPVQQQVIQGGQQQPQYVMPQPQVQVHPQHQPPVQPQPHPQPQVQPQPQAMPQSHPPTHPQAQPQLRPQTQPYPQLQPHLQQPPQLQPQTQPQLQTQPVPHAQVAQPHLQQQYPPLSQPQPQIQAPVQQLHASAPQPHPHAQSLPLPPPHAQPGGQLLQPQPRPNHPQPQPHHLLQPSQIQAAPQHLQSLPPQQHPHAQMQHPQSHPQQHPPPHSHPLPQHQQPHTQPQAQPMPQPHPFPQPQPQPQHPSAQAVSGHQSYPQPQPVQQYPMQVPTQQHNPQHPMQAQNQFPQPQTSQMRPPHSQLPVQVQQQPNMVPPQGPHVSIGSSQSQAHHLVQQGQQMHQYPGMQLRAQSQGAHVQPHPGQSQQMHPQQQLHAQGHQYMQQQGPVQPQLQQSVAPAMSHEAQVLPGRSLMPNQGMQQPPYQQSPASNKPLLASVNQQSPNKSYSGRAAVQHDQFARPESQVSASAALQSGSQPNPLVSEQSKQSADLKTSKSEVDFKSENREATAADVTEEMKSHKDSKVDEDGAETHLNAKDTKEQELKPHVQEDAKESSDAGKESSDKGLQNSVELNSSAGTMQLENINSQGQANENIAKNIHASSQHTSQQQNNIHDLHRPSAGQGSYPVQSSSFGQSPKLRPPAPERMFPEHVPQPVPNQDRKLPGPPPQMQVFGQAPPSAQMGPPLRNVPETFPYQGQPSMAPHGSYPSQVPHPSLAGPDVPPSSTMPPGPFGHQQNYMPPPHSFGPTNFQGQQPLGRPGIGAPPSGPGGSAFGMENQMGPSHPGKSLEAERYGVEKAGFSGWQHEPRPPALGPFGQPHSSVHPGPMSTNGLPKERYGPVSEENFRPFPEQPKVYREERIVPSTLDLKRFEEDMKRFPRPDHLDREGRPPYDGHMSSTRPFDMPQPFGGPFPPSSGGLAANPTDYGDRLRPLSHHEDLGRRHDPLRSSGGEYTGSWQGKFGSGNQSHMNDFTSRDSHGFDERSKTLSLGRPYGPGSIRKDIDGTEVLPSRLGHVEPNGFGGIHNLRMGDPLGPGNLSTSRHGYPGETKAFNSFPIPGGMDSIEYSKMRKPGSMGLCRICKIDCETVEGLDLHSQTREHQKMAMHMVLSIKQENAKRQKLNYEGNVPFEDANRARKPNFESHMNWA